MSDRLDRIEATLEALLTAQAQEKEERLAAQRAADERLTRIEATLNRQIELAGLERESTLVRFERMDREWAEFRTVITGLQTESARLMARVEDIQQEILRIWQYLSNQVHRGNGQG